MGGSPTKIRRRRAAVVWLPGMATTLSVMTLGSIGSLATRMGP
jgi:hypothetical protein